MTRLISAGAVPLALLAFCLGGCSVGGGASATPSPTAKSAATPVPSALVGYASLAEPTLKTTIHEGDALVATMKYSKAKLQTQADDCTLVGGDLSNFYTSFTSSAVPPQARAVHDKAVAAYKIALAATDECGLAADTGKRLEMKTATTDLQYALGQLRQAESVIAPWYRTTG